MGFAGTVGRVDGRAAIRRGRRALDANPVSDMLAKVLGRIQLYGLTGIGLEEVIGLLPDYAAFQVGWAAGGSAGLRHGAGRVSLGRGRILGIALGARAGSGRSGLIGRTGTRSSIALSPGCQSDGNNQGQRKRE